MLKFNRVFLYITASALSVSLWTATSFAQQNKTGITTASMLNMRKSPDTSTQVIDQIPNGYKVSILESSNGWHKVLYNEKEGWVYGGYVSIVETAPLVTPQPKTTTGPKEQTPKVTTLPKEETPKASNSTASQTPVVDETLIIDETLIPSSLPTNEGEAASGQTDETDAVPSDDTNSSNVVDETLLAATTSGSSKTTASNTVIKIGIVDATSLNVRQGAGLGYSVVGKLSMGDKVNIIAKKDGWYQVKMSNGSIGWVYSTYILSDVTLATRGEVVDETLIVPEDIVDPSVSEIRRQVVAYAKKLIGVKYVYGGNTPGSGFDCSGFVKYVFDHFDIDLNRIAADQAKQGKWVAKSKLIPGDMVFFDTNGGHNHINHVGIYIGEGKFIHASSGRTTKRVVISDITSGFYSTHYMTARRILD